jgi:hypothetical protein
METGAKCICQYDDWYNAFGDKTSVLHQGQRLVVRASKRVGGARFLSFDETPEDHFFLESGFKPMRALN